MPGVRELREKYPDHNFSVIELTDFSKEYENCSNCPGLASCPNQLAGHRRKPHTDPRYGFTFAPCQKQAAADKHMAVRSLIKSHNMDPEAMAMTFDKLEFDVLRVKAITAAMEFCDGFKRGETTQGIYLRGNFGVGKSGIVGAIANELAVRNVDTIVVYVPDFTKEIKSAIRTGEVDAKIDAMINASVLILDDIGAEPLTQWTRDEVIGSILQNRMNRLPTIFTSNLSPQELESHFANAKDDRDAWKKAARLMERIEPFVSVYEVGGRNRRRDRKGA
ncbi:primosomal protein DnaI [Tumebacillus sp. DT12]|uniref:Primosomal protein DnaI n=1 Tax=Tumebacillus lacus TaxID=2995335 RepID=A0ABT3X421_9BACL|nr:primosomal protein DnaI [Tumebacillus lacus]MCX7570366.1 primosomal protein DnaI [Tumebacillus lacus]